MFLRIRTQQEMGCLSFGLDSLALMWVTKGVLVSFLFSLLLCTHSHSFSQVQFDE
jgi:hypothetical protein